MRGMAINFTGNSPMFTFTAPAVDIETIAQNAMVNLGTQKGSDPLYADRGTDLLDSAVQGRMINTNYANQVAAFAALDTLVFAQTQDNPLDPNRTANVELLATKLELQSVTLALKVTDKTGTTIGVIGTL